VVGQHAKLVTGANLDLVEHFVQVIFEVRALGISRSSIYRLFEAGELAWVQIGASRRVTSAEIHRFIAAHTEASGQVRQSESLD
jgi:excisionase family DNA binding protein